MEKIWLRSYQPGVPAEIEVRPLYGLEDFAPSPAIERFRALDLPG